ncbi:MAG: lamin tail domain-containing protein [Bacteroidota bacterium]
MRSYVLVLLMLLLVQVAAGQQPSEILQLNEFMASNASTLADEDGAFSDWIEILNLSSAPVDLSGWSLTDDIDEPAKWVFSGGTLSPGDFALVFASGKDRGNANIAWETFIDKGDQWQYFVGETAPPDNWLDPDFDDTSWEAGASGFGYGDDDDATLVDVVISVFVRKTFTIQQVEQVTRVLLDIDYDDGFVAYLNGIEVARANVGVEGVRPAFDEGAGSAGEPFGVRGLPPARFELEDLENVLQEGENVLAIEVHNASLNSSDLTLIPFLTLGFDAPQNPDAPIADDIAPLPGEEYHTNFKLGAEGEYLALVNPEGIVASAFDPAFPPQSEDLSYGFQNGVAGYLASPTPGEPNSAVISGFAEAPVFSVEHGFFDTPFSVTLRSSTPDAMIRYTLDGSPPTSTTGTRYEAPITIEKTAVLRTVAYKAGYLDSPVATQTYLFLDNVAGQIGRPEGWPTTWGGNVVDYGMNLQIAGLPDTGNRAQTIKALQSIPSVSLAIDLDELFDADTGIYANAFQRGRDWERPASVEFMFPDGTEGVQINAGVRIRGGFSRSENNPKHAFRLFFRDEMLKFPAFEDEGVAEFENLDLRTSQNYSWSFNGDTRNTMNRDVFSRDTQRDMGDPYTRSRYYHLYINGLYWGLFQSQERSEASFAASYFDGDKDDFDVLKSTGPTDGFYDLEVTDGNATAWVDLWTAVNNMADATDETERQAIYQQIQGRNPDGSRNTDFSILLDVDNLINYTLINFYTGNFDAPISWFLGNEQINNFYAIINRVGEAGFKFFTHDNEHSLLPDAPQARDRTGPYPAGNQLKESNPMWIHQQLMSSPAYRIRFADLAHKHLRNGGILTEEAGRDRFLARAAEIEEAIWAESARWGDSKRQPSLTKDDWQNAIDNISNNFFPGRSEEIIQLLRISRRYSDWRFPSLGFVVDPLFPAIDPPAFNQHGGNVSANFLLSLASEADSVYFTMNGPDPRLSDGAISPDAVLYSGGAVALAGAVDVQARAIVDGQWSALNQATFFVDAVAPTPASLVISEIHYNPSAPDQPEINAGFEDNDDFEFIELFNTGNEALHLSGLRFADGISFTFDAAVLPPASYALLVKDAAAFAFRYGADILVAGEYDGKLSNSGENLVLQGFDGTVLHELAYGTGGNWPSRADGSGSSLELLADAQDLALSEHWQASPGVDGSPGAPTATDALPIRINEVLTHTDLPLVDAIELFNQSNDDVDISGWYLSDSDQYRKFAIPTGTVLPAGGFIVFDESDFNADGSPTAFALNSASGDEVSLVSTGNNDKLLRFEDHVSFGATANGETLGRWPDGTGALYPMLQPSLGSTNAGPKIGDLVFREIMYHPPNNDRYLEYVEVINRSSSSLNAENWQIEGGVSYTFPDGLTLGAGEIARIVPFDPSVESDKIAAMQQAFSDPAVQVLGPWDGRLNNAGETLLLTRPDMPPIEQPDLIPRIEVDRVGYSNAAPWPTEANGAGAALVKIELDDFSDDPSNWTAESRVVETEPPLDPVDVFELVAPFPNPAFESATFSLVLEEVDYVRIALYDVLGRQVQVINESSLRPNERHQFTLNTSGLASGVYFIHIIADRFGVTESIVVF